MITKERQIIKELSLIFALYVLIVLGIKMDILGTIPQWLTAFVAIAALLAAYRSIENQKEISRKRAATDFFIKTEMDAYTLEQHQQFKLACNKLKEFLESKQSLEEFSKTQDYLRIRDYLNLHELMGVGINREVFDDIVCEDFWARELYRACRDTKPLIEWIQKQPDEAETYVELIKVNARWQGRKKIR